MHAIPYLILSVDKYEACAPYLLLTKLLTNKFVSLEGSLEPNSDDRVTDSITDQCRT